MTTQIGTAQTALSGLAATALATATAALKQARADAKTVRAALR